MHRQETPRHSSHWGAFVPEVADGRVIRARPVPEDPDPSALLESVPSAVHAANRVLRPAVRRGWLSGREGGDPGRRGKDGYVEVDWDTALDLVAGELLRVRAEHGHDAVFGGSYGWSSAGRFHHAKTQLSHFLATTGGYVGQISNYSFGAADAVLPHVVGDSAAVLGGVPTWQDIREGADTLLMFGGAPAKNVQVEPGGVAAHRSRLGLLDALDHGVRAVNVNPVAYDAPPHRNLSWLPIRPGTDTALILALTREVVRAGRHDRDFLDRCTVGADRYLAYLDGSADGVEKSAGWASGITGIPERDILALAATLAGGRTMVTATWSLQRADHGEQPYWAVIALAAVLGGIGLRGTGFGFGYGSIAGTGNYRRRFGVPAFTATRNPLRRSIPVARMADMLLHPGREYEFNGARYSYPDIRLVYWAGGNPFHHHQDLNRLVRAWQRPETIIVHEPWWTPTARHADIVLPATTTLERDDIAAGSKDSFITAMRRVVPPVGEARNDHAIFRGLAERLGVLDDLTGGRSERELLADMYEQARADAAVHAVDLPGFEDFWRLGSIEIDVPDSQVPFADFRADPAAHPLATPSGRIELFSERVAGFGYPECPGHPVWLAPYEWLGDPDPQHPLHLLSPQPATRLHSQLDMAAVSLGSKIRGYEPCVLHAADAADRGIADGDLIRIFNVRGSVLAGAELRDDLVRGVALLATGAWFTPEFRGDEIWDVHGNPNALSRDVGSSRMGQAVTAQTVLVQIERYDGPDRTADPHAVPELHAR
ncbi:molybdopterin-dependent oxidoreductase [Nakamurella sp. YIM 132087]|uniref:Molybdopterin-dependent oxidoreductase n=1 Tax=Nakamurella alba TaxID=2665158 RepID=A0A7K1FSY0_9ACTN|nr:molybdopterin-dependent oxidoreductase [Nakamurella alba]MTD16283.1 molybdopterin-dependent oxidoreductase [Nakamurella alba]